MSSRVNGGAPKKAPAPARASTKPVDAASLAEHDREDAENAYRRVLPEALALGDDELTALNVHVVAAASMILGVAPAILSYRDEIAKLHRFDIRDVDQLQDRARAAWFVAVTLMPETPAVDLGAMVAECQALRTILSSWAVPLVTAGIFDSAAIALIQRHSGKKGAASAVTALVKLYREKWSQVRGITGVTEEVLERSAKLSTATFAEVSRREQQKRSSRAARTKELRRFWTLADRSYAQCGRAIAYLEFGRADVANIVPSLRRNAGPGAKPPTTEAPAAAATELTPTPHVAAALDAASPQDGDAPRTDGKEIGG